ncbi:hypothetical protein GXM_00652 [Nostoc sphaeroides CCNUC1]|uniref:Uncharacterized protein n=1 Tax=Nostoc sphaeroides CCNUC1 TaxID=2653204 RepID=A0A5P8VTF5_9NOSO|nr:hypothetical protein GXM_00652 [Nostoc sphaeroides CCNUC1]
MGSRDNSFGLSSVKVIGSPNNQVAKSLEKFSAKNLQILSKILEFYQIAHSFAIYPKFFNPNI